MSQNVYPEIARIGLTLVHRPAPGINPVAHIILVHGLFGSPEKTWTGNLSRSKSPQPRQRDETAESLRGNAREGSNAEHKGRGVFWPASLLPKVVDNALISTWGYDADIDGFWSSASQNTVGQHATNLLTDIADFFEESKATLPIIFVVHSLGGIVIKAALNQSGETRGTRLKVVVPEVRGIIFLGTPHRGSSSASLGRMAYQITTIATRRPNQKLLRALEKNSDTLEQVANSFLQTLEGHQQIQIYSFREEKETRRLLVFNTIVVEPDSAKIGLAKEEVNSIPASHSDMTKFSSQGDIGFKRVSAQLRRWVQSLATPDDEDPDPDLKDLVASLDAPVTRARMTAVTESHANTLQWLYQPQIVTFADWLQESGLDAQPIYWIQGLPGSGKSTLMRFAMLDSRTTNLLNSGGTMHTAYTLAGYFFHDRGSSMQKSISGMFQGLLHSILVQVVALRHIVLPFYEQLVDDQKSKTPKWDQKRLELAFEAITTQRDIPISLCLFLDALDEHLGDNEQLVLLMKRLVSNTDSSCVRLKFCLASRPWDTFVNNFSSCPGFKIHEHTFNDILEYASSKLHNAAPHDLLQDKSPESARLDDMAKQIAELARGVFIWVRIVVEEIANGVRSRTPHFVLVKTLAEMPKELEDLYTHTLGRIEPRHAEEAFVMLQIALCALAPLSLVTFVNSTSFAVWEKYSQPGEESDADMVRRVISRSGGLLEVVDIKAPGQALSAMTSSNTGRSVQFIHQTVKEYVQHRKDNFGLRRTRSGGNGFEYLLMSGIRCWGDWSKELGVEIFEYATRATDAGTLPEALTAFLSALLEGVVQKRPLRPREESRLTRLDWWLQQKADDPHVQFYTRELFNADLPDFGQLVCLAFAAGLGVLKFGDIEERYPAAKRYHVQSALRTIAILGPSISSAPIRRTELINHCFNLTPHTSDLTPTLCLVPTQLQGLFTTEKYISKWDDAIDREDDKYIHPLSLIIHAKGEFSQDEGQRVSAIRTLLDCFGSDANKVSPPGVLPSEYHRLLSDLIRQVIKQESAEIVKLFGDHGAKVPVSFARAMQAFWFRLQMPSQVFEEVKRIMLRDPDLEHLELSASPKLSVKNQSWDAHIVFPGIIGMSYGASSALVPTARKGWPGLRDRIVGNTPRHRHWTMLATEKDDAWSRALVALWRSVHPEDFTWPEGLV